MQAFPGRVKLVRWAGEAQHEDISVDEDEGLVIARRTWAMDQTVDQFGTQVRGPGGAERKRDLTRRLLAFLIRERIVAGYAARHGISVSGSEIDHALAQLRRGQCEL